MKVKRNVIKQGATAKAIILPGFWYNSFVDQGYDIKEVWVEIVKDDNLLITPILIKKK